jgi:UDP-N-acetylglucosamine:LPS N-acetylglucosamine transferase
MALELRPLSELEQVDVLLACSSGGHLAQLFALSDAWRPFRRVWVTEDTSDAHSMLAGELVVFAYGPAHRDLALGLHRIILAWARNLWLAMDVVRRARPRVVLTTGAAIAVPFAWIARLAGARVVFVESLTRIDNPSVSYRLISPIASRVYVQWPELAARIPRARYVGAIVDVQ